MKTVDEELKEAALPCINLMNQIYLYISFGESYVNERRWLWGWIENEKRKVLLNPVSNGNLSLIDLLDEMRCNIENSKESHWKKDHLGKNCANILNDKVKEILIEQLNSKDNIEQLNHRLWKIENGFNSLKATDW